MMALRGLPVLVLTVPAVLWGCGGGDLTLPAGGITPSPSRSTVTATPSTIQAGSGTSTITVTVLDDSGAPVSGVSVTLHASGGGTTMTRPGPTDAAGVATASLQSDVPGEKLISATVNGSLDLTDRAAVTVVTAMARIESAEGDGQQAAVGAPVAVRPAVRVLDAQGNPMSGVRVTFAVTGGGGSIDGADQTTDADGIARAGAWTLGPSPGTNTLEARTDSVAGSPVIFTAEAVSLVQQINRLAFLVQPHDAKKEETIPVQVGLVDANGNVVPLSGVFIYVDLFPEGSDVPDNQRLRGDHFANTTDGVAALNIRVERKGHYRLRALTDDLPELGPHGPEPYLFSEVFEIR